MDVVERFMQYVEPVSECGCWLWVGHAVETDIGPRGRFHFEGRNQWAPRVAMALFKKPLLPSELACHTCDVSLCVRPDHLFAGSHQDNIDDMRRKGRAYRPTVSQAHCKRGHEFTAETTRWQYNRRNGYMYRQCVLCMQLTAQRRTRRIS